MGLNVPKHWLQMVLASSWTIFKTLIWNKIVRYELAHKHLNEKISKLIA